jgi:hypothetical protein
MDGSRRNLKAKTGDSHSESKANPVNRFEIFKADTLNNDSKR